MDKKAAIITLEDITMKYEKEAVLKNFNLQIEKGEFVTVIGSSGCGKTTVLKLINGLLVPQEGTVYVKGEDVSKTDKIRLRRNIGYVIQETGLFPHMTVRKNITYVVDLEKEKKDIQEIEERIKKLLTITGLQETLLERYPEELSGGQRQRVGIARALMANPEILLMDEPFGAVDGITRRKLQKEILTIYKTMNCTIVFITHDINEALRLGTRVIVMDKGEIVQQGTPFELKNNPTNEFVAELVQL